jgi:hypothetical protein
LMSAIDLPKAALSHHFLEFVTFEGLAFKVGLIFGHRKASFYFYRRKPPPLTPPQSIREGK